MYYSWKLLLSHLHVWLIIFDLPLPYNLNVGSSEKLYITLLIHLQITVNRPGGIFSKGIKGNFVLPYMYVQRFEKLRSLSWSENFSGPLRNGLLPTYKDSGE